MKEWIKEISLTLLSIAILIIVIYFLIFKTCSTCADFLVPVPLEPGGSDVVLISSYDKNNFDLDNYIDRSNETGDYPTFGWTGEYYITGVTHGEVRKFELGFSKIGFDRIYSSGSSVPEPSTAVLIFGGIILLTRRRHGEV